MKKAFVIDNKNEAERLRQEGYLVKECEKSVQVAQALTLAFFLSLEPTDVGVFYGDVEFLDRDWFAKVVKSVSTPFFSINGEAT